MTRDQRETQSLMNRDFSQPYTRRTFWIFVLLVLGAIGAVVAFGYMGNDEEGDVEVADVIEQVTPDIDVAQEPADVPDMDRLVSPNAPRITNNVIDDEVGGYTDEGVAYVEELPAAPGAQAQAQTETPIQRSPQGLVEVPGVPGTGYQLVDSDGNEVGTVYGIDPSGPLDQQVTFTLRPELQAAYNHNLPFSLPLNQLNILQSDSGRSIFQLTPSQTEFVASYLAQGLGEVAPAAGDVEENSGRPSVPETPGGTGPVR